MKQLAKSLSLLKILEFVFHTFIHLWIKFLVFSDIIDIGKKNLWHYALCEVVGQQKYIWPRCIIIHYFSFLWTLCFNNKKATERMSHFWAWLKLKKPFQETSMPLPLKSEKDSKSFRYVMWLVSASRKRWVVNFLPRMAQSMVTDFQNKDKVDVRNAEMPLFPCSTLDLCSWRCCLV